MERICFAKQMTQTSVEDSYPKHKSNQFLFFDSF